jgi:hypothetical protein
MYLQKVISRKNKNKKLFFVGILKVYDENSRIRIPLVRGMNPRIRIHTKISGSGRLQSRIRSGLRILDPAKIPDLTFTLIRTSPNGAVWGTVPTDSTDVTLPKALVSLFLIITAFFSTFMAKIFFPSGPSSLETWKTLPNPPVPSTFRTSKSSRQTGELRVLQEPFSLDLASTIKEKKQLFAKKILESQIVKTNT